MGRTKTIHTSEPTIARVPRRRSARRIRGVRGPGVFEVHPLQRAGLRIPGGGVMFLLLMMAGLFMLLEVLFPPIEEVL